MGQLAMFDSVTVSAIPPNAAAVAGYTAGRFPTFPVLARKFPKAHVLSIAVASRFDAECLDIEPGDATNLVAADWVKRQQRRGVVRPVVYTSLSNAQALLDTLAAAGVNRTRVRLWTAHYTHRAHICTAACGFGLKVPADGTQWTDRALGRNLDESLLAGDFFPPVVNPADVKLLDYYRARLRLVGAWLANKYLPQSVRDSLSAYAARLRAAIRKLKGAS